MTKRSKKPRLIDIAELAGVSVATVSIILNDPETTRFSSSRKEEVIRIAKELNYAPNLFAQSLVSNRTKTIGLIIPDLENPFFARYAKYLEAMARNFQYTVLILNSDNDYKNDILLMEYLYQRNVDGVILAASADSYGNEKEIMDEIDKFDIPIVVADRSLKGFTGSQVVYDNRLGLELATQYCIDKGHRKIGFISTRDSSYNGYFRHLGYQDALLKNHIEYDENLIHFGNFDFESGYEAAKKLLGKDITAVVASNDLMAFGFKKEAEKQGYLFPEGLSIVGFDNIDLNNYINDGITSINLDTEELAEKSLDALFALMFDKSKIKRVIIKPTLFERDSVKSI